jgi:hypothetical protein
MQRRTPVELGADVGRLLYRAIILAFISALDSAALPPPATPHSHRSSAVACARIYNATMNSVITSAFWRN